MTQKLFLLSIVLKGVAAFAAILFPAKREKNVIVQGDGQLQFSTIGGVLDPAQSPTVRFMLNGPDSYTISGKPCNEEDQQSATSIVDGDGCSITNEMGNFTVTSTTH